MTRLMMWCLPFVIFSPAALAITIGGFDLSRGDENRLDQGARRDTIAAALPSAVVVTSGTLTSGFLSTVDVLILDVVASESVPIIPLSSDEQDALTNWVQSGGGLLVASDNIDFQLAANSILEPLGLTAAETAIGGFWTTNDFDRTVFPPLLDAPFGRVDEVGGNFIGSFSTLGGFQVIGRWSNGLSGQPSIVAHDSFGSGRIVVTGDHQMTTPGHRDADILLLNAVSWLSQGEVTGPAPTSNFRLWATTTSSSSSNPNTLLRVSAVNGAQTLAGAAGLASGARAMDWDPITERVMGTDIQASPGVISEIDVTTGISTPLVTILESGSPVALGALAFSGSSTLYAAQGNISFNARTIGIVDLTAETYTSMMTIPDETRVAAMDFSPTGVLYAVYVSNTSQAQTLVRIKTTDFSVIDERPTGAINVSDMDFAADGYIYHTNPSFTLLRIDPDTAEQSIVGAGALGSLTGLASITLPNVVFADGFEPL